MKIAVLPGDGIGPEIMAVAGEAGTTVGSGGMITKIKAARVLMVAGIPLVVCDGHRAEAIVDAAVWEDKTKVPALLGFGSGNEATVSFNRRMRMKNGLTWSHPRPGKS